MPLTPQEQAEYEELEMRDLEEREAEEIAEADEAAETQRITKPRKPEGPGSFEAFTLGAAETLSPIAKYGTAAGIKARTAIEDLLQGRPSAGVPYGLAVETAEELSQQAKEQQPGSYYTGMGAGILGGLQSSAVTKIPTAAKALGIGAGTGAVYEMGGVPLQQIQEDPLSLAPAAVKGAAKGVAIPIGAEVLARRAPIAEGVKAGAKQLSGDALKLFGVPSAIQETIQTTRAVSKPPAEMKEVLRLIQKPQQTTQGVDPFAEYMATQSAQGQAIPPLSVPPAQSQKPMQAALQPGEETIASRVLGGSKITPEDEATFLLNLLQPGKTPAKEFYRQKVTQLYPGQQGQEKFQAMLEMPSSVRAKAREFDPSAVAKALQPSAIEAKKALGKSGEAFATLQELASQEYKRTQLPGVSNAIKLAKSQFERPGTSALARNTVDEIDMIINQGSALPRYGVKEGPLKSANAQEAYKRLQAAREYADRAIRKNPQDLSVQDVLMPLREQLDDVLKSSPSKVIADALYAKGKEVKALGISPLEKMRADKKPFLSGKRLQTALGDTEKGEMMAMGIQQAKEFTKEFAQQLGPQESAKIDQFFTALEGARTVAEQKRIIDSVKFAEGPSGSALRAGLERLQQTLVPAKGGAGMFTAAPEYLQNVDAFMAEQAAKRFGKTYDQLSGSEQLKLVNMFQWFKRNPEATLNEMESAFSSILRGTKK